MTDPKDPTFTVAKRPTHLTFTHRGQPRAPYVQAVLDTFGTGKAVTFLNDLDARQAYSAVVSTLRRLYPSRKARKYQLAVWIEARTGVPATTAPATTKPARTTRAKKRGAR